MAIDTSVALVQILRQYRLLEPAALEECARLQTKHADPKTLARELVTRKWLTPYQINQIFQGKGQELLFGSYILIERLGEGGMGQVFKARNWKMDRTVALKVIRKDKLKHPEAVRRFMREVKAAAQLHHPNIVIAYDADAVGDTHFIAMEYVEGMDLGKLVKDSGPLPVPIACELIRQAALGLQHAFERGLVHRDIKPTNLLVERLANGSTAPGQRTPLRAAGLGLVKVLDMGLARLQGSVDADGTAALTQDGAILGTPDFLSPEQSRNSHQADIRSDLYALGCTFYYLLTGKVPFPADTLSNKIWKQNFEEPTPVEVLRPEVPPGIGGIIRRLMAKSPEQRYQTPADLAADLEAPLERTLAGESLSMGGLRAGTAVATAPAAILVSTPTLHAIPATPSEFQSIAPTAVLIPPALPTQPRAAPLSKKRVLLIAGAAALALVLLSSVALIGYNLRPKRKPLGVPLDTPGGSALSAGAMVPEPVPIKGLTSWTAETHSPRGLLTAIAYRPDGKVLATATDLGTIRTYNTSNGKLATIFIGPPTAIQRLAFAPEGKVLACGCDDRSVFLLDPEKGTVIKRLSSGAANTLLFFSRDGRYLFCNGPDHKLQIFEVESGTLVHSLTGHTGAIYSAIWSPDGARLATGGMDRSIRIWDPAVGKSLHLLTGHTGHIVTLAWSPDGTTLASGGGDNLIHFWDAERGRGFPRPLEGHTAPVYSLAWSSDSRRLASGSSDGTIRIWGRGGRQQHIREKVSGIPVNLRWASDAGPTTQTGAAQAWEVENGAFLRYLVSGFGNTVGSPDGNSYITYAPGYGFQLFDITQARKLADVTEHPTNWSPSAAWSPDGNMLVTTTPQDASILIWNTATGEMVRTLAGHRANPTIFAWSPDGKKLGSAGGDNVVRTWDPVAGKQIDAYSGHKDRIFNIAWSPDSKKLASASADKTAHVWDVETNKTHDSYSHKIAVYHIAWSPDGATLATRAGEEQVVRFWRHGSEEPSATLTGHKGGVTNMAWSPDGKTFATASYDMTARIWNAETGAFLRALEGHANYVFHVAYSPDSKKLATGSYDRTARLYELETGRLLDNFQGHPAPVESVTWLSDIAVGVHAGKRLTIWSTSTGKPLRNIDGATACWYSADHKTVLGLYQYGFRSWDTDTGRTRATIAFLRNDQSVVVNGFGHYRSIPRNLPELVYVAQTEDGQRYYDAREFAEKFRWTNSPDEVRLRQK